jgi:hypothetical protein
MWRFSCPALRLYGVGVELYQIIAEWGAFDPSIPAGSELGREFFAFGGDPDGSRGNSRELLRIPCQGWAGNSFCPGREFFCGWQGTCSQGQGIASLAGLVPAIPIIGALCGADRDRRDKPGDDEVGEFCPLSRPN